MCMQTSSTTMNIHVWKKKITFWKATAFPTFLRKNATAFVNAHSSQIAGAADTTNLAHYTPHSPPAQHSSLLFSQQCSCCKSSPKDSVYKDCVWRHSLRGLWRPKLGQPNGSTPTAGAYNCQGGRGEFYRPCLALRPRDQDKKAARSSHTQGRKRHCFRSQILIITFSRENCLRKKVRYL